jgi:hypothetical protein
VAEHGRVTPVDVEHGARAGLGRRAAAERSEEPRLGARVGVDAADRYVEEQALAPAVQVEGARGERVVVGARGPRARRGPSSRRRAAGRARRGRPRRGARPRLRPMGPRRARAPWPPPPRR